MLMMIGNGSPNLGPGIPGTSNDGSDSLVVEDFNGDSKLDFASAGPTGVSVLLGDGKWVFTESFSIALPYAGKESLAVGDYNGDGKRDLAVKHSHR